MLLDMELSMCRPMLLQAVRGAVVTLPLLIGCLRISSTNGTLECGFPVLMHPADKATTIDLTPVPPAEEQLFLIEQNFDKKSNLIYYLPRPPAIDP